MKKIELELTKLNQAMRIVGARPISFEPEISEADSEPIDVQLEAGLEVTLKEVELIGGLLSVRGRQVLLYIPDQGWSLEQVLRDGSQGKKFHVADCRTLRSMRDQGRFERYVATNKLDGVFRVHGKSAQRSTVYEGDAALKVCQNCLIHLNYQGYRDGPRGPIFKAFTLVDFFEHFSTSFRVVPKAYQKPPDTRHGYTEDWKQVSEHARKSKGYTCEQCGVILQDHKYLCHVHHKNGVRHDNSTSNLIVLCAGCHKLQPAHGHLFVTQRDQESLTRLRLQQGLLDSIDSWEEAMEFADTSYHGALRVLRSEGAPPPVIGFEVQEGSRVISMLEVAWPRSRVALLMNPEPELVLPSEWRVCLVGEVLLNERKLLGMLG